jgi:hypothetical protein
MVIVGSGDRAFVPEWVTRLEKLHGVPIQEVPGSVYILHWDMPTIVLSVSADYGISISANPITHYVGWTSQDPPRKRINNHSRKLTRHTAEFVRKGTMLDEERIKREEKCPQCGEPLRLSLIK